MGLVSVTASNLDQSIAGDIVGCCGYWRTMSSRSFRVGRSVTGLGLFAIKPIKRGAYIATYRGRRITTEEADRRAARGASYMFEVNKRWTIDGSPRWNVARYINHSCRPNAKPVGRKGGIVIVALRQIEPQTLAQPVISLAAKWESFRPRLRISSLTALRARSVASV
jgi:hypothetical protein